jgi:TPR repeat protein
MSAKNDEVQALKLIAEQGDSCAQLDLGSTYLVGDDVQQDFTVARLWLQLAAENGEVDA